ncbi:MFS transporter, allantoate permease [Rhodotorula toruloides]|uniref:MFS transporter, allantoate permease n=1 Tax=Rhodotorula toruloides TaxID=5286 RepID=A0A511KI22_RHOTO|nr:MFS transporter, allantoate permease [Rhodotorula toruloides]
MSSERGSDVEKNQDGQKEIIITSVQGVDAAALATAAVAGQAIDPAEARRLVRKIDLNILPLMCLIYLIQFLDKVSLSYASIMGIRKDNHLTLGQYSWLSSIFYFLGLLESCVTPAFSLITSQWYKKNEQGTRTGIWFSMNAFAQIFGAVLAWGFTKHDMAGDFSIPGWKVLFIFLGSITMALGVLLFIFLPDSPLNARFLNKEERVLAVERIRSNNSGIGSKTHKWYQVREALLDPLTWLYCLYAGAINTLNGGITSFFSILISSLGFDVLDSLLYGAPGGAVVVVAVIFFLWLGDRIKMRCLCGMIPLTIGLVGILLIWLLPFHYKVGRLIGYYISGIGSVGFIVVLSLIGSNVAGSTKKATVLALFFIFYSIGNLCGPQSWRAKDAPRYAPALATAAAVVSFGILDLGLIWFLNARENRRRDKIMSAPDYAKQENVEFLDRTDRENLAFRYIC